MRLDNDRQGAWAHDDSFSLKKVCLIASRIVQRLEIRLLANREYNNVTSVCQPTVEPEGYSVHPSLVDFELSRLDYI